MSKVNYANKNSLGIVAKKIGTTHIYEDGCMYETTVLSFSDLPVVQNKTQDNDGYSAVQISYGTKKQTSKAIKGHFGEVTAVGNLMEFRLDADSQIDKITLDVLDGIKTVKVTAKTKGKGFAGPVKRWGFRTQDATHGNSLSHRAHGSTGQCQFPGRVFKGKKMAGRMGHTSVTVKNLRILKVDKESNLVFIAGSVPGAVGTYVKVLPYVLKNKEDK